MNHVQGMGEVLSKGGKILLLFSWVKSYLCVQFRNFV